MLAIKNIPLFHLLSVQSDWNGFFDGIRIWVEENPETIQLKKLERSTYNKINYLIRTLMF
ncbi:hypothetical protein D920_00057 [Enterococcus faecalis 13-SD-W-01]|nr:hypothetical protein D920_00057 [Enterococcus faecalis 13-SD-W-01]